MFNSWDIRDNYMFYINTNCHVINHELSRIQPFSSEEGEDKRAALCIYGAGGFFCASPKKLVSHVETVCFARETKCFSRRNNSLQHAARETLAC